MESRFPDSPSWTAPSPWRRANWIEITCLDRLGKQKREKSVCWQVLEENTTSLNNTKWKTKLRMKIFLFGWQDLWINGFIVFAQGCQFYDEHSSKTGHLAALCSFERLNLREVLLCVVYSCGRNKHIRRCSPPVSNVTRIPILYWLWSPPDRLALPPHTLRRLWMLWRCVHPCLIFPHQPRTNLLQEARVQNRAKLLRLRCFFKVTAWKYPWRPDLDVRQNTQKLRSISENPVPNFSVHT